MPHTSLSQLSPNEVQSCWNIAVPNKSCTYPFHTEARNGKLYYDKPIDAAVYSGFHENNDKDMFFQKLELLPSVPSLQKRRRSIFRNDFQASRAAPATYGLSQFFKDGSVRSNAFVFELTSILGKKFAEELSSFRLDSVAVDSSVSRYERFCDGAFIGSSSKLQYFRNRTECQFPITFPNDKHNSSGSHTYCFTRTQKLERRIVLQTGLTRRSRILKRLCRPVSVKLHHLTPAEIRKHISEKEALQLGLPKRDCAVRVRRLSAAECNNLISGGWKSSFALTGKEIEIDGKVVIDLCSDDESDEVVVMPKRSVLAESNRLAKNVSPRVSRSNSLSKHEESSVSMLRDILATPKAVIQTHSPGINGPKFNHNLPASNGHNSSTAVAKRNGLRPISNCKVVLKDVSSLRKTDETVANINTQRKAYSLVHDDYTPSKTTFLEGSRRDGASSPIFSTPNKISNGALSAMTVMENNCIKPNHKNVNNLADSQHVQDLPLGVCNDSPVQKIKNKIAGMLRLTESSNLQLPLPQNLIQYLRTQFAALASEELSIYPVPSHSPDGTGSARNGTSSEGQNDKPDRCEIIPKRVDSNGSFTPFNREVNSYHAKFSSAMGRKTPEASHAAKSSHNQNCPEETPSPLRLSNTNPFGVSARSPISGVDIGAQLSVLTTQPLQVPSAVADHRQRLKRNNRDQQDTNSESSLPEPSPVRACVTRSMTSSPKQSLSPSLDIERDVLRLEQLGPKTTSSCEQDRINRRTSLAKVDHCMPNVERQRSLPHTPSKGGLHHPRRQSYTPSRLSKGSPMTPQVKIGFKCHICGFAKFFSNDSQSAINDHIVSKHGGFDKVTLVRNARRPVDCILYNAFLTKNLSSLNGKQRKVKS